MRIRRAKASLGIHRMVPCFNYKSGVRAEDMLERGWCTIPFEIDVSSPACFSELTCSKGFWFSELDSGDLLVPSGADDGRLPPRRVP